MRLLPAILLLALLAQAAQTAAPPASPTWPLWDGSETVEQYAKHAGLEPTQTLDLGNGVSLELVLIPAGKFVMGTPEPESVWIGGGILVGGGLLALVLIAVPLVRAMRQRRRPQFSLRWLILLVAVLGVAQYGGFRWWRAAEAFGNFNADESPAHEVTISKPFYLGKYEVTQEQYEQVTGMNPSYFMGRDQPVERVSWHDAQAFCKKASEKAGLTARLPTEAEWEYACRAGTKTTYYTGDSEADLDRGGWYGRNTRNNRGMTHAVGQKAPSAWGLYDMHGNACEWCEDWYGEYKAGAAVDSQRPTQGQDRVLRGGSWADVPWLCRSVCRCRSAPDDGAMNVGFRVAADFPSKAP